MRPLALLSFALLFMPLRSFGQDDALNLGFQPPIVIEPIQFIDQSLTPPAESTASKQIYTAKIVEFRFKTPPAGNLSSQEILDQFATKDNPQIDQVESISVSALAGYESTAHYGRSTSVTTAVSNSPNVPRPNRTAAPQDASQTDRPDIPRSSPWQSGTVRHTQQRSFGTILRVTANPQDNLVLLKLQYEASRIIGEIPDDTAPDNQIVRIQSTLLVEPGKPTLLSGSTAKDNSYLVLLVEKN